MNKCLHKWEYVSHWELQSKIQVRRICIECDEWQIGEVLKWTKEEGRVMCSQKQEECKHDKALDMWGNCFSCGKSII